MSSEIAVLIILHQKNYQTISLIEHLSKDFDLYIHVDKKASFIFDINNFRNKNKIYIYKEYSVYHGRLNMILATLLLMREAKKKLYKRYIIISGSDIPLKKNSEIIKFFRNNHNEYFTYHALPFNDNWGDSGGLDRMRFYYANNCRKDDGNYSSYIFSKILSFLNKRIIIPILRFLNFGRKIDYQFYGGSNWLNLTHNGVECIFDYLNQNPKYLTRYKYTLSGDEIFFQTIICNFSLNLNLVNDDLRFVDWSHFSERPYVFRIFDFPKLHALGSNFLFARKFDLKLDSAIIDQMYTRLK